MSIQDRREFDKFLKFLTAKVVQTVVQSRRGERIRTKSVVHGNDWFNVAILDDKQVSVEMKHSLEGRLPDQDNPISLEITVDTVDGESLVLETWTISLDPSVRDISVSVSHSLYPRLSLMLKSVICLSRSTPTYRYSRNSDDGAKFNFRVYCGRSEVSQPRDLKHVTFASTACPYGTISLSVSYRTSLTLHSDRSLAEPLLQAQQFSPPRDSEGDSLRQMDLPFAGDTHFTRGAKLHPQHPFSAVLPKEGTVDRQESNGTVCSEEEPVMEGLDSLSVTQEREGFVMVNVGEIKPAFVPRTSSDELSEFLQECNEEPTLDMFTEEGAMNVAAALELIDKESHKNP